jgi:thiol-disulfide isomerase/thioredoxin
MLVLSGCAGAASVTAPDLRSRVDVDNAGLRAAKRQIGVRPCPGPDRQRSDLPDLTLPCLGGGQDVTLSRVAGPAVVSLWASWCTSCPHELPLFQRLSRQADGRLDVLGVDYQDTQPGAALTLLDQADATFPQVADPGGSLADRYRVVGLPGILFVDAQGRVTFMLRRIEDYAELTRLVAEHTGVDVGRR